MKKYLIPKEGQFFKANLHCHSTVSDGKLTPAELKEAYKNHGYSILCITDHETPYDHTDMTEPDFLMLTGYESHLRSAESQGKGSPYVPETHICLIAKDPHNVTHINFDSRYCKYATTPEEIAAIPKAGGVNDRDYSVEYINNFLKVANENGYLCTHNHPVWSLQEYEDYAGLKGLWAMEVYNNHCHRIGYDDNNSHIYQTMLKLGNRFYPLATDDFHPQ